MCDKRDKAISYVFCRDLHLTSMFSGLLQKNLFKGKWILAKSFFKQNYCHACHTRVAVFFPLPSCCVSSLITKIVRARSDWPRDVFAWEYVNMCGVKMFCSSRANHTSTNFKMFLSWKLDKFTLFTHSLVGWNLENLYKHAVPIFFRLSWHFKREKPLFGKHLYCKTGTDKLYKTSRLLF